MTALRRRVPERLRGPFEEFRAVVGHVESAKAAVTDAVPTTRLPGRTLAEALGEFEDELLAASDLMPSWRAAEVGDEWSCCRAALDETFARAERLRMDAPEPLGFEALIATVGDLLAPLEAFAGAADRFRDLRERS